MSKKHFIALADAIRELFNKTGCADTDGVRKEYVLEILARFCQQQNSNFNRERWLDYIAGECGPSGGSIK